MSGIEGVGEAVTGGLFARTGEPAAGEAGREGAPAISASAVLAMFASNSITLPKLKSSRMLPSW